MMFRFLFLILLLLRCNIAFSIEGRLYAPYYRNINEAELCVVVLDFEKALKIYAETFAQFEKHRTTDLYNAALCAILTEQIQQATLWIKELIEKGATLNKFRANTFKQLPQSVWEEISQEYDSLRAIYFASMDIEYMNVLDTIRNREQRYVILEKAKYDSIVYEHSKLLHKLIEEKGIPRVSMFEGQLLPIDVIRHHFALRNQLRNYKKNGIDITSAPYCHMEISRFDLEPLLINAVFLGDISPHFVAMCMENSELDSLRQLTSFEISIDFNSRTISYHYPKMDIDMIDAYREYLGLESLKDAAQKNFEVALFYNQEVYPFEEHIRRFNEIGYSKITVDSLKDDEKNRMLFAFMDIIVEIKNSFMEETPFNFGQEFKPAYIFNNRILLNEFQINQISCKIEVIPPS